MLDAYKRKPASPDWPRPSALIAIDIIESTGQRRGLCVNEPTVTEWFIRGTEPTEICVPGLNSRRRNPSR
jgi:hypothetical protein